MNKKQIKTRAARYQTVEREDESNNKQRQVECPRCGFEMKNMTACHLRCNNCGAELTCSDKSFYW